MKAESYVWAGAALALALVLAWGASRRLPLTIESAILECPVAIPVAASRHDGAPDPAKAEKWGRIAEKFLTRRPIPSLSHLLHHLENWSMSPQSVVADRELDGTRMLSILTSNRVEALYLPTMPMLYQDPAGSVRIAHLGEEDAENHPNQVLASCASLGLRGDQRLRSGQVSASIAELVSTARDDFNFAGETEWTILALARYAPTPSTWKNRWGETFSFDSIATHYLGRDFGRGPCAGTHALQVLAVLLRVNATRPILTDRVKERVRERLAAAIRLLDLHQRSWGYWAPDWPLLLADPSSESSDGEFYRESDFVLVTGHHLDWLRLAPEGLAISDGSRRRALAWCEDVLDRTTPEAIDRDFCPYSHCFRALEIHFFANDTLDKAVR